MTGAQQPAELSLNIHKPYFDLIASGAKIIEVRVGYRKIRKIKAADSLRITCGDESLTTRVTAVKEYGSFTAMLGSEDPAAIGGPDMSHDQLVAAIRDIYPPEKEALGVFALYLTLTQEDGWAGTSQPRGTVRAQPRTTSSWLWQDFRDAEV